MAIKEIDETEYASLVGIKRTVDAMLAKPDARKLVLNAQKLVNPNVSIPEIDAAAPVQAEIAETQKTLAEIRKEMADERAARALEKQTEKFERDWEAQKGRLRAEGFNAYPLEPKTGGLKGRILSQMRLF